MKSMKLLLTLLALSFLVFQSCKSGSSKNEDETKTEESADAKNDVGNNSDSDGNSGDNTNRVTGEVVDFQLLKNALPESLAGLKRTSHTGQKSSFATIQISSAEASYAEGDKTLNVTITDTGGLGMALAGMAAWSSMEMASETDTGYEKTTTIDGHKAYEKYDKTNKSSEVSVIYDNRFIVSMNGSNLSMEEMHDAVKKIDIKT